MAKRFAGTRAGSGGSQASTDERLARKPVTARPQPSPRPEIREGAAGSVARVVKTGDTLSKIANEIKPAGVSLMLSIMDFAREKGLTEIEGLVLANNPTMLKLMRNLGFQVKPPTATRQPTMTA